MSYADEIAEIVADLNFGRVVDGTNDDSKLFAETRLIWSHKGPPTVIDATEIYESLVANSDKAVYLYEDHPCIGPPFPWFVISYRNEHGNVLVMSIEVEEPDASERKPRWETTNETDWSQVRWLYRILIWVGGRRGDGTRVPTFGPVHAWYFAVYSDGRPADLTWVQLREDYPIKHWHMAQLVVLGALNFLNCNNVELIEPERPRAEKRRIQRTGVTVSTLVVRPLGQRSRGGKADSRLTEAMPLTSVRGHFAHYGPEYGRGLLFGKLAGRFWIPQHAVGSASVGEKKTSYRLSPKRSTR